MITLEIKHLYNKNKKPLENDELEDKLFNSLSNFIIFLENENKINIGYSLRKKR
jgi:hypothetical protein